MTYLLTSEVAERLRVSPQSVRRYVRERRLHPVRTPGGHSRFVEEEVEQMRQELESPSGDANDRRPVVVDESWTGVWHATGYHPEPEDRPLAHRFIGIPGTARFAPSRREVAAG